MWFNSELLNTGNVDEASLLEHPLYRDNVDDLVNLNVTKENYLTLVKLSDFLMIDNPDDLIDKIVEVHDYDYSIIYTFADFYKLSKRIFVFETKESLREAIMLHCQDHVACFRTYGFTSFWDVSNVTNMSRMFAESQFDGDISRWDVSNVTTMRCMFKESQFDGDISRWDVSNVTNMGRMFSYSRFNGDISEWDVSNVKYMIDMFDGSQFNGDISRWDVSNVTIMVAMFRESQFDGDISRWDVSNVTNMSKMFEESQFDGDISEWDVSNVKIT